MAKHKVKRYDGEDGSDVSADPSDVSADPMEQANQSENLDTEAGPKAVSMPSRPVSRTAAPVVTKEQLAKSGLSLRDYLNKQQGLTRRGESVASGPGRSPTPPRAPYETPYDRMNRKNNEMSAAKEATADETARLRQRNMPASKFDSSRVNPNTLLPNKGYAKGGSVSSASSRADGIATKGKTRGTMVMCSGGMAKGKK